MDSGLMVASQILLTLTATFVTILLARGLSAYQFGIFASFLAVAQGASFIVDAGVATWLLRQCSAVRTSRRSRIAQDVVIARLLRNALTAVILFGAGATSASVVAGFALGIGWQLSLAQGAFMCYVALLAWATAVEAVMRADRAVRAVAVSILAEKIGLACFVAIALGLGAGILGIGVAYVFAGMGRVLRDQRRVVARLPRVRVERRQVLAVVRECAPFASTSLALTAIPRLDIALVAASSAVSASYFTIGFQVVTTAALLPGIAVVTLMPLIWTHAGARSARRRVPVGGLIAGSVVTVVGIVLAPTAVPVLFGSRYRPAVEDVQIMLLSVPLIFGCGLLLPYLYTDGRERAVLGCTLPASIAGSGFIVVGLVVFGVAGACGAFVLRQALFALSLAWLSRRTRAPHREVSGADWVPAPQTVPVSGRETAAWLRRYAPHQYSARTDQFLEP